MGISQTISNLRELINSKFDDGTANNAINIFTYYITETKIPCHEFPVWKPSNGIFSHKYHNIFSRSTTMLSSLQTYVASFHVNHFIQSFTLEEATRKTMINTFS